MADTSYVVLDVRTAAEHAEGYIPGTHFNIDVLEDTYTETALKNLPKDKQVAQIEAKVNEEIAKNHDVTIEFMNREQAADIVDLSKLPEDASETLRIVRIGDYDVCACIGAHVKNTSAGFKKIMQLIG